MKPEFTPGAEFDCGPHTTDGFQAPPSILQKPSVRGHSDGGGPFFSETWSRAEILMAAPETDSDKTCWLLLLSRVLPRRAHWALGWAF